MLIESNRLLKANSLPPEELKPWLNYQTSLTDKLKRLTGDAELEVLSQEWSLASWWDKFTLGLSCEKILLREILMLSQGTPCWYARTIIPESTYLANQVLFSRLKQESLGQLIFNEAGIRRTQLLTYAVDHHSLEYNWIPAVLRDESSEYWLRLSNFTIDDSAAFCLVEIFLPGLRRVAI